MLDTGIDNFSPNADRVLMSEADWDGKSKIRNEEESQSASLGISYAAPTSVYSRSGTGTLNPFSVVDTRA
jgi:hypothetical protein